MRYGICLLGVLFCIGPIIAQAQPGYVQIKSEPGITIYLNGDYKGITSTTLGGYLISNVPPGTHKVRAEKEGAPRYEIEVTVASGQVTTHEIVDIMTGATIAPRATPARSTPARQTPGVQTPPAEPGDLQSGTLIIRSVPEEMQITIPDLGVRGAVKRGEVWQKTRIPRGTYTAAFKGTDRTLVQRFSIGVGRTTQMMVNFDEGSVTVSDQITRGQVMPRSRAQITVDESPATPPQQAATPSRTVQSSTTVTRGRGVREYGGPHGVIFVAIPSGSYTRGSADGDADEQPVQRIQITKGFQMSKYEVTQQVWEAVMGEDQNHSMVHSLEHPVEMVSWTRVQRFITKLNEVESEWMYRLPTEAEWEYAARAGTQGRYYFGNDIQRLKEYARYSTSTGTQPVGRAKPNAWGLYDMHGNVWEWVSDWYQADYYTNGETVDPQGPRRGTARVQRGGSWSQGAPNLRVSNRAKGGLAVRSPDVGFRLVRVRR